MPAPKAGSSLAKLLIGIAIGAAVVAAAWAVRELLGLRRRRRARAAWEQAQAAARRDKCALDSPSRSALPQSQGAAIRLCLCSPNQTASHKICCCFGVYDVVYGLAPVVRRRSCLAQQGHLEMTVMVFADPASTV